MKRTRTQAAGAAVTVAMISAGMLLAGCAGTQATSGLGAPVPSSGTAAPTAGATAGQGGGATVAEALTGYYRAVSGHDWTNAARYADPTYWQQDQSGTGSWRDNLVSLTDVTLGNDPLKSISAPVEAGGSSGPDGAWGLGYSPKARYDDLEETTVSFTVQWREVVTSDSGRQLRFDIVGHNTADNRWYVLGEGSGP